MVLKSKFKNFKDPIQKKPWPFLAENPHDTKTHGNTREPCNLHISVQQLESSCDNSEVQFHNAFDGALLQASLWKAI